MDEVCQWLTHLALYQNLGLVEAQGDGFDIHRLGPLFRFAVPSAFSARYTYWIDATEPGSSHP